MSVYDAPSMKDEFLSALKEFFGDKSIDTPTPYDVSNDDREAEVIIPAHVRGDDPVSVAIVADTPIVVALRGSLAWGGQSTIVNATPQLIVGKDARRRTVIIKNLSMNDIALDSHSGVKYVAAPGYGSAILPSQDTIVLDTRSDIWAIAASGSTGEGISIYQVFDDGQ